MKIKYQTLFLATFLSLLSCTSHDNESYIVSTVASSFLEAFYTCDFAKATAFCTSSGVKDVCWFASNLTEDELALMNNRPKIEIGETIIQDTIGIATFYAHDVLVTDSLEETGRISNTLGRVLLVKRKDKWMVKGLEW